MTATSQGSQICSLKLFPFFFPADHRISPPKKNVRIEHLKHDRNHQPIFYTKPKKAKKHLLVLGYVAIKQNSMCVQMSYIAETSIKVDPNFHPSFASGKKQQSSLQNEPRHQV